MPHHNWFRLRCTCLSLHISWILSVSSIILEFASLENHFAVMLPCSACSRSILHAENPSCCGTLHAPGIGKGDPLQQNGGNIQVIHAISSPSRKPHKCIQNNTKYTNTSIGGSEQHTHASNEKHNLQSTNQNLQFLLTVSHNNII